MATVTDGALYLDSYYQALRHRWAVLIDSWRDGEAAYFTRESWDPLIGLVGATQAEIPPLDQAVRNAWNLAR